MSPEKKSKRQQRREKVKQQETRSRLISITLIVLGAAVIVLVFLSSTIQTVGELTVPEPRNLSNADGMALGDPNAPATIDVFEDFQCPACQYFSESVEPTIIQYLVDTGKARLVFHHYPFIDGDSTNSGGESDQAANASMCANEQGKFWDMKEIIYANWNGENRGNLNDRTLKAMAESIGLDTAAFNSCFDDNKYAAEIQADFDLGLEMGVSGTPSVFVNGQKVGEPGKIATFQEIAVAVDAIVNSAP